MRNTKKRWLRVLPNMVCLTLIFVMLFHVSVTTNSLPLSEAESSEPKDAVVLRLLDEAPELPEMSAGGETEDETALPAETAPNASAPANEQLSYSTLMSLNTGFYYYTYCNYNGQRHTIDLSEELQLHTFRMAQKYGVQYELVMAVMGVESGWDEDDRGNGTFVGLGSIYVAQLKELKSIGITDLYDPKQNIEAICYYLRYKLDYVGGNEHMALMCYNSGEAGAQKYFDRGIYQSTYSNKVIGFRDSMIAIKMK